MALAIIAEFDNSFYQAFANDSASQLLEPKHKELFRITVTSSNRASEKKEWHLSTSGPYADATKEKDGVVPEHLKYYYCEGYSLFGNLLRLIYRVLRVLHVSVWFYFLPYFVLLINYVMPLWLDQVQGSRGKPYGEGYKNNTTSP